ncbi:MAG: hypothetical protein J6Y02_23830 [Pseudobutyrivibrio sp.]|nr:hypothetical protein [Pseudobutyrivibrio sp.]
MTNEIVELIDKNALIKHLNTTMYRDVMEEIKNFPSVTPIIAKQMPIIARQTGGIITLIPCKKGGEWIKDRNPNKDGDYLCITGIGGITYSRQILHFANDLYKVDPYCDFHKYRYKRKDKRGGWYGFDSEGYYEITDVYAWCELPEIPEEFRKEE